jgi:2-polyprenyl-3-methyl-5-hydroxy-6-metoxy-1,4-benzoquinol methylase
MGSSRLSIWSPLITTRHDGRVGNMPDPWNANIHYDARLDACVPSSATSVLEAGCGDGFLAARLARRVPHVVAIDLDAPVLERARTRFPDANVTWCHGDVLTYRFGRDSFDAVVSNATLHHLPDSKAALHRLSELVRPGGTLAIVGFARTQMRDWPWAVTAFFALGVAKRVRRRWEHTAPQIWPPRETFRQLRRNAHEILPGARISRLLLGRYLIVWHAPG